jgi:hypothetical protein
VDNLIATSIEYLSGLKYPVDHVQTNFGSATDPRAFLQRARRGLLYRGSWILDLVTMRRLATYSLFFPRLFLPGYMLIPCGSGEEGEVIQALRQMAADGLLEVFHLEYHSYLGKIGRLHHVGPAIALEDLANNCVIPRTKVYFKGIAPQSIHLALPLLTTVYSLRDEEYREVLLARRHALLDARFGSSLARYERMAPQLSRHLDECPNLLARLGFPTEGNELRVLLKSVPHDVVDYCYYTNLSYHWVRFLRFGAVDLSRSPWKFAERRNAPGDQLMMLLPHAA